MANGGTPVVSVIIPAYQHADFVEAAVESVLSQTLSDIELILVDDASKDNTVAKLEKYRHDSRFILISSEHNGGPSVATNYGLAQASGRYVALMGSDDVAEPWRLEHQVDIAEKRGADAVFSEPTIIDESGRLLDRSACPVFFPIPKLKTSGEVLRYLIVSGNFLCAPSALLRRDAMSVVGTFDTTLWQLQDYDYWLRMAAARMTFCLMERPVIQYRVHGQNLSGRSNDFRALGELSACLYNILTKADGDIIAEAFPEMIAAGECTARPIDRAMIALSLTRAPALGVALTMGCFLNHGPTLSPLNFIKEWHGLSYERLGALIDGSFPGTPDRAPYRIVSPTLAAPTIQAGEFNA